MLFLVLQFYLKNGQKKEDLTFLRKKTEEKQNSVTIMISVDRKGTVFPVKLKLEGNCLNKDIKNENLEKDPMDLTEKNHQINMTSEHAVSSNNWF